MSTAYLVLIGNELLSGKITDTNGAYAIQQLRRNGVDTVGVELIPDEEARIVETVRRVLTSQQPTLVITSGGIGPTHDDITMAALAVALDKPMHRHPVLEQKLRDYYGERINDDVLSMADLPAGAELTFGEDFFPLIRVERIYVLPGEPTYFRKKIDLLTERISGHAPFAICKLYLARGESTLAAMLRQHQQQFPDVAIGSYPRYDAAGDSWYTLVTLDSRDESRVRALQEALLRELPPEAVIRVETT